MRRFFLHRGRQWSRKKVSYSNEDVTSRATVFVNTWQVTDVSMQNTSTVSRYEMLMTEVIPAKGPLSFWVCTVQYGSHIWP